MFTKSGWNKVCGIIAEQIQNLQFLKDIQSATKRSGIFAEIDRDYFSQPETEKIFSLGHLVIFI